MTGMEERIRHQFGVSIEAKIAIVDTLVSAIAKAGVRLVNCLLNDGKILVCGNGGSAANCLHFSTAMQNHFDVERPPLPVIALSSDVAIITSLAGEGHYDQIFARQIQAIAQENDLLLVLTTTGNSDNLLHAVNAANDRGMDIIVLGGREGGVLSNHLGPEDLELTIPGDTSALIREVHLFILHCFCDLIDQSLFGQMLG